MPDIDNPQPGDTFKSPQTRLDWEVVSAVRGEYVQLKRRRAAYRTDHASTIDSDGGFEQSQVPWKDWKEAFA